jgi:magnesium transporter
MTSYLLDRDGHSKTVIEGAEVQARLEEGDFFWLDLHGPTAEDFRLMREVFKFHPLAVEDAEKFGQRAKIEAYDDFYFLVFYGVAPPPDQDRLVELHCFFSDRFLVTVRRDASPACDALRERYERQGALAEPIRLLYQIVDALVDSFFPALEDVDDEIDGLQDAILAEASDDQLQQIYALRRRLARMRSILAQERDLAQRWVNGASELPHLSPEGEHYLRDVYDHLVRLGDRIETYRELLMSVMDTYFSANSRNLNTVVKQLTVIAAIFLPLSFIAGFFGQNFGWLVRHISGWPEFFILGLGLQVFTLTVMLVYFKRRGWF